jgi:hypothetical protein
MNDSEKNAMLVLQKMCDIKSTENTIVAETINTLYNLIKRQQAEIERLNIDLKAMRGAANSWKVEVQRICKKEFDNIEVDIEAVKFEAVKEFAEKLKEHSCNLTEYDEGGWNDTVSAVKVEDIDRLVGEMGCNDG